MSKRCFGNRAVGADGKGLPFSPAVRAGDWVYVSGQVAFDDGGRLVQGGIVEQTRQALSNVKAALALAGCDLGDVVKVNVWLDDARDFGAFNTAYAAFFPTEPPARSTVRSELMIDAKIEIDCVAYKPA